MLQQKKNNHSAEMSAAAIVKRHCSGVCGVPYKVVPQPLTLHINPPLKTVPCAGSGSASTALANVKGVAKYRMATSLSNVFEL